MNHLARNVVTTYVARFSNVLGLFFLFPLVSGVVSQPEYGVYLLSASLVSIFALDLGMAGSTTRFVSLAIESGDVGKLKSVMASSWVFFFAIGAAGACAVAGMAVIAWDEIAVTPELAEVAAVCTTSAALQVWLSSAFSPNRLSLAGAGRLDVANLLQIGQVGLRFGLTALVVVLGPHVGWVALADLVTVAVAGVISWLLRRTMVPSATTSMRRATRAQFAEMFGLTRDFLVLNLAALVVLQSGNLIVALALAPASVAVFAAAQRIYQVARELTNSLTAALLPAATANHAANRVLANASLYVSGTKYSNVLLAATLPPVVVFMHEFVTAWVGESYVVAAAPAMVLVGSMFINNQHLVAVPILGGQGNLRVYSMLHATWAASAIILGFILVDAFGVIGMAVAIAVPLVVLEPFYVAVALRRLSVSGVVYADQVILRPLAPAIALAPFLVISGQVLESALPVALGVSAGWLVSYLTLFFFCGLSKNERQALVKFMKGFRK